MSTTAPDQKAIDAVADWSVPEADWSRWFEGKVFTHPDYVSCEIGVWTRALSPLRGRAAEVLEVGSLEGRSALFFLNYLRGSRITCIDPFPEDRERVFDANLAAFTGRVEKLKSFSLPGLVRLRNAARKFDVIYIDGDHHREVVMLDSVLSWPMLRPGGVLMWDDYRHKTSEPAADRPGPAIDGFLVAYAGEFEELHRQWQLIVRKTGDCPAPRVKIEAVIGLKATIRAWRKRVRGV
jgi:Methyltransferase domain